MKLRTNLFQLVLGTALPFVALAALLIVLLVNYERDSSRRAATERNRAFMTAVDTDLRGIIGTLQALATSARLQSGDFRAFRTEALNVLAAQPYWLNIIVLRPTGEEVVNAVLPEGPLVPPIVDPDTIRQVVESRKFAIGNVFRSRVPGHEPAISVRVPVLRGGDIRYIVTAVVRTSTFQRLIDAQQPQWVFGLVDSTGHFIARRPRTSNPTASEQFMQHARSAPEGWYRGRTLENVDTFTAHVTSPLSGWIAGQAIPASQIYGSAIRAGLVLGAGILAVIAAALAFAWRMGRRITIPVSALVARARFLGGSAASMNRRPAVGAPERASAAALAAAPAGSGIEEIRAIEHALNESAEKLHSQFLERDRFEVALEAAKASAEQAKAEAEKANRAKDHFLAVLSHELRTPLAPVLAAAELLQRRSGPNEDAREPLEIIRRNVQLQARLIDDLLDLTRIAQGKLELKRHPIDICTVIERAVETAKPDIDARGVHFGVSLKDGPHFVEGDASRLQQVVWNLLRNAVKFTREGGCVGLCCERRDGHVVIEVSDSGIGIEPEAADRIFDAFEQGGPAITRQFGGLGLGLAIAKRLVEQHEGTISMRSEGANKGATFSVRLPLSDRAAEPQLQVRVPRAGGRKGRILLVEDNGDSALIMKMLLETDGYAVETAGNVEQALTAIDTASFDLLISDLGLPDRSGIELMQELRRRGLGIRGIALSGYGRNEDMLRSTDAGFSAHLVKPVDAETLMEAIATVA